jgi:hypothetical protein
VGGKQPALRERAEAPRSTRAVAAIFFALFAVLLLGTHLPYWDLPPYWDELGQFVPASLDLFHFGDWIPTSTLPNVHPPGLMAYLAGVWTLTGYSITATRVAMLLMAAWGALGAFLLAIRLTRGLPGYPAFAALAPLLASPLFFTQSMMAQLDLPAMVFGTWAWLWFLEAGEDPRRHVWSAAACAAAVAMKETAVLLPLLCAVVLVKRNQIRLALPYLAAPVLLGVWLIALWGATGHPLGNREFAQYNAVYSLHPVRLLAGLSKRFYYLFLAEFRWIGLWALLRAWRLPVFRTPEWRLTLVFAGMHLLMVTVLGGALLERYLLPVLPILYLAMAAAFAPGRRPWPFVAPAVLTLGLIFSNVWNPPYPFPFENNLAVADFVELHRGAAQCLESAPPSARIATAWPLSDALRRPEFGYTSRPRTVVETTDFSRGQLDRLAPSQIDILVLYSRTWSPEFTLLNYAPVRGFLTRFFGYEPPVSEIYLQERFGLYPNFRLTRRGQWVEIYSRTPLVVR